MASKPNVEPSTSKKRLKQRTNKSSKRLKTETVTIEVVDEKPPSDDDDYEEANENDDDENGIDWDKLEEVLKENAEKANLTTVNVKSILHHILKDKRVIEYAQNVAENNGKQPLDEAYGETTKMTRSKTKLLGQEPLLSVLDQGFANKPSVRKLLML